MGSSANRSLRVATAAFVFTLAACGGGGGDSGASGVTVPTATRSGTASTGSDLSAANAGTFVGPLARIFLGASYGGAPGVGGGRESPQARSGAAPVAQGVMGFAAHSAARTLAASSREQAQAVRSDTQLCPFGGSIFVTVNDADNNNKLSRGDSSTLVFTACVAEFGLPAATGTLSFTVNAVELNSSNQPTALDASFTLNGFIQDGLGSISGGFRAWYKDESPTSARQRVSYQATTVTELAQTLRYDFDQFGTDGTSGGSFDLNGAVTIGGQTYVVSSDVFTYTSGALPTSGALRLRDAAGDTLILRARSATTFDLEFQANGASSSTVLQSGLAWSGFRL